MNSWISLSVLIACVLCLSPVRGQEDRADEPLVNLDMIHYSLQQNLNKLEASVTDAVYSVGRTRVRLEQLQTQEKSLKEQLADARENLTELETHLNHSDQVEIHGRVWTLEERRALARKMTGEIAKLEENLEVVATSTRLSEETLTMLEQQISESSGTISDLHTRVVELGARQSALRLALSRGASDSAIKEIKDSIKKLLVEESESGSAQEEEWIPIFNGKDLDGWTPKIRGYECGDNFGDTFRVEDGLLKVGYEGYGDAFDKRFGHLFYKEKISHYILRIEYRFVGEQIQGGPGWAWRNSGVMLHGQDPKTMTLDQEFPVSIEMQMLGGNGTKERPNANVCTPGTHIEMNGNLITRHCLNSSSQTYHGDQWVTVEIEVRGDEVIRHKIDGEVVLEYQKPQLDPNDADAKKLIVDDNLRLTEGYFSLQSESHPIEFRSVELKRLDK